MNQELTLKYNSVCNLKVDNKCLKYLRINPSKEVKVFQHKIDKGRQIYLLPTNYDKIYVFITSAKSLLWQIERGKTTYVKEVKSYLKDVELIDSADHENYIWIPFFKKTIDTYDLTEFLYTFSNSEKIDIKSACSAFDIEISGDIIDKGVQMKPGKQSLLFDDDFIFGFVHSDIEDILDIPLTSVLIEKKDFLFGLDDSEIQTQKQKPTTSSH